MRAFDETSERISRSGEAVFAVDSADRIILWNKACERLLSRPPGARSASTARRCSAAGTSTDNLYCHRNCPSPGRPANERTTRSAAFDLAAKTGEGKTKKIRTSLFSVPSYHPGSEDPHPRPAGPEQRQRKARCQAPGPAGAKNPLPSRLSPVTLAGWRHGRPDQREKEILRSLADGLGTNAIAKKHSIAAVTVRNHVQSILHKLDVHTKVAAVVLAYRHGLV